MDTQLGEKMRVVAKEMPEHSDELNKLADAFMAACETQPFDVKKVVGTWARARRRYCEITGEPLV